MKTIVVFYSKTGNNRYLAKRMAPELDADIEEIQPSIGGFFFLVLFSALNLGSGLRNMAYDIADYDRVVIVGPVWMGKLIAPLRSAVQKAAKTAHVIHFATCCGSDEKSKDDRFGYEKVFSAFKDAAGSKAGACAAFSIKYAVAEDKRGNDEAIMAARLSDETFTDDLKAQLKGFIAKL